MSFWESISADLVRYYFSFNICFSNWILSHFSSLSSLILKIDDQALHTSRGSTGNRIVITDRGFQHLTNLTSLKIQFAHTTTECLFKLSSLTVLEIDCPPILKPFMTNEDLSCLSKLSTLKLGANSIFQDSGIKNLINLTHLDLANNVAISDEGVRDLINLKYLRISNPNLTNECLVKLTKLSHLVLECQCQYITNKGLSLLTSLTTLESYAFEAINDKGLMRLTNLTKLKLETLKITDSSLMKLTNLTSLTIYNENAGGENLELITVHGISHLVNLRHLCLNNSALPDFEVLANLPIESLGLHHCDENVDTYKCLTNLKKLDLTHDFSSNEDLKFFPNLTKLNIAGHFFIDSGFSVLTNLTWLNVSACAKKNSLDNLTKLTTLIFSKIDKKSRKRNAELENLNELPEESHEKTKLVFTNSDLIRLPNLTYLDIVAPNFIDFDCLIHLTNLKTLCCGEEKLSFIQKKSLGNVRILETSSQDSFLFKLRK